jgi:hypothetical protein
MPIKTPMEMMRDLLNVESLAFVELLMVDDMIDGEVREQAADK